METCYKLNLTILVLGLLIIGLEERLDTQQLLVTNALHLVSATIKDVSREQVPTNLLAFATEHTEYRDDLPSSQKLHA